MLRKLTDAFGVSGCETEVREIIIEEIKACGAELSVDNMGNLLAFKKAKKENAKTILLSAHMDEVGFIVTDITEDGYVKFQTVGGIDARILVSKRVRVNGKYGVIGLKPVHLTSKEEREKTPNTDELFVDIGAKDREDAESVVTKGDYFGFDSEYIVFGEMIKAKALDDRLGCAIMIDILKKEWNVNLVCAFNVQEEVGLRGARIAAKGVRPDFALVIEGTTCNDLPNVPESLRVTKSGGGSAISVLDSASKSDRDVCDMLIKAAEKRNIPWQYKASTAGGNDAGSISLLDGGVKTASISVPCRYIHSPVSVIHKLDFQSCKYIVEGFLEDCGKGLIEND